MNKLKSYGMAAAGILILVLGFFLLKAPGDPEGFMQALPYVCIGLGCGMFGHGMGTVVSSRTEPSGAAPQSKGGWKLRNRMNAILPSPTVPRQKPMICRFLFSARC